MLNLRAWSWIDVGCRSNLLQMSMEIHGGSYHILGMYWGPDLGPVGNPLHAASLGVHSIMRSLSWKGFRNMLQVPDLAQRVQILPHQLGLKDHVCYGFGGLIPYDWVPGPPRYEKMIQGHAYEEERQAPLADGVLSSP